MSKAKCVCIIAVTKKRADKKDAILPIKDCPVHQNGGSSR